MTNAGTLIYILWSFSVVMVIIVCFAVVIVIDICCCFAVININSGNRSNWSGSYCTTSAASKHVNISNGGSIITISNITVKAGVKKLLLFRLNPLQAESNSNPIDLNPFLTPASVCENRFDLLFTVFIAWVLGLLRSPLYLFLGQFEL